MLLLPSLVHGKGQTKIRSTKNSAQESLSDRRWSRRLFHHFYKIQNNLTPPYLRTPIPPIRTHLVIVIVSILIALDVGTKLALNYVILSTLSVLNQAFYHLSDFPQREFLTSMIRGLSSGSINYEWGLALSMIIN